ncbi:DUF177 domain-containing protein [Thermosulfurimonas sp. F29]|uniref:YceD family protein n=1 Tax=Thermosulfurimonas sp. F29 TaxID=2867247 RepID=UPI001C832630|nr:DUF177 domain-containing protein [Thermosulfurimonas sp. F29]MBX6422231.1 DUF177 domain-containing protein [Thermosulfurimonas sp. F29]
MEKPALRIPLEDIPPEGLRLEFEEGPELLADCFPLKKPLSARVFLKKEGINVKAKGRVETRVELSCDRCLERFEMEVREEFEVEFRPVASLPLQEETRLSAEDLEVIFFEGNVIPVDELVREQVILAVPYKKLCREDCRGLCPRCGKNLNEGACGCAVHRESPFAVLKNLLKKTSQAGGR